MLKSVSEMKGLHISATDGEIGLVDQFLFDDENWAVRYLVVNTGDWLAERLVLITPISLREVDWTSRRLHVALTKKQVEESPDIDSHKPVSRQREAVYMDFLRYPYYWGGPYLWGSAFYPTGMITPLLPVEMPGPQPTGSAEDSHLRSTAEVNGYHIEAVDGEIGHVEDFIVDPEDWAIQYIEASTRNWLPGKKVLIAPSWIQRVSWDEAKVYVDLPRAIIQDSPEYVKSTAITREYEARLHEHYGRGPYWERESRHAQSD